MGYVRKFLGIMAAMTLAACTNQGKMKYSVTPLAFTHSPEQIDTICADQQQRLTAELDRITRLTPAAPSFEGSVLAMERAATAFNNALTPVLFLKYVSTDAVIRKAADRCEQSVQKQFVDIFMREDLFRLFKAVKDSGVSLSAEDSHLLDEYLTLFRRNGLELAGSDREEFSKLKKELVSLEADFSTHLVEWDDYLAVSLAELDGLPQSYIDGLETLPDGKRKVTLAYPDYYPFMDNAKNAETRRRLQLKFYNRGGDLNRQLLERAISIRHRLANLLGYATHAHFVLERRMAKTPHTVNGFLEKLKTKLIPKGRQDLKELLDAKREDLHDATIAELRSEDTRYYENWLRKNKYQVDNQLIKEYFPLEKVVSGMFEIYQTLLGVQFVKIEGATWSTGVDLFEVRREGTKVAMFYMDLFPRDGKYGHAAAFTLIGGSLKTDGTYELPISSIVANFNAPGPGKPSLLEHSEVETLFHEFGHIMHQVLTQARYATFSGTSVKTDFVEAPSQMLENWVWDKQALTKLSGHYTDTSKPLPEALVQKITQAKLLNVGLKYLRQLSFAMIDMAYHTVASADTTAIYKQLSEEVMLVPIPDGSQPQASFGHLMGGYDSGYYGYLWSKVYAQDLFTRFEKEGLLNPLTGGDYLKWILSPGGQDDPFELIRGFLGREPNEEAFLKSLGL